MKRRILWLTISFLMLTGAAQGGLVATPGPVDYVFAQRITFRLSARSDSTITSAVVIFRAGSGPEQRGAAAFTPGKTIDARHVQALEGGVLPPFSTVTYWWEVSDAAGRKVSTPAQTIEYVDNRFQWQDEAQAPWRVRYYAGDAAYARQAIQVAQAALPRINAEIGAAVPDHVDLYLYPALEDLASALMMGGRDWQGGQARPDLGVVLIAIPPGQGALAQMKRDIPHELTHLLVYQATGHAYAHVPHWLDEGLAVANEELAQPSYGMALEAAAHNQSLIPLETLCAPFSADATTAELSYAESQSFVQFIRNRYPDGVRRLLAAYSGGATCTGGVQAALGQTLPALEAAWRASLLPAPSWTSAVNSIGGWVLLALLVPLAFAPLILARRKGKVEIKNG